MHRWNFHRIGGLDQASLATGADLAALAGLDQKLWVALSCPTRGLELDERTLALLDLDKDGRVRASEIIAAIEWCKPRLRDLGALIPAADGLPLAAIDDGKPEGKALLGAARRILRSRGKDDAAVVACADVADLARVFEGTKLNGDGVITAESPDDPALAAVVAEAVDCLGGVTDRSGKPGVDQAKLDAFFAELQGLSDWSALAQGAVLPLGEKTPAAFAALKAVRARIDDFFTRCRVAAFDPRSTALLNRGEAELAALAAKDLSTPGDELKALPLARVEPGASLHLLEKTNPAWSAALENLHALAAGPLLGAKKLDERDWKELQAKFAAYEAHLAAGKGAAVEKLGAVRARQLLSSDAKARLAALIADDAALRSEADAVADAARLAHYKRDLHTLLKNFVNFSDFYDMSAQAIFQAGTLYFDSRSFDLCVRVDDPGAHAALAALSRMYIAYCDLRRPGETMKIAACVTQGDRDYLMVGRNGIFYDRKGRDWDATVVKIIDHPISMREAFFAPYKKFVRMVEEQVQKFAAAKEKEADATVAGAAGAAPPSPVDVGKMVGIIAALGVGVGALGTLFGAFVSGFLSLEPWWAKPLAAFGVLLIISGPSVLLAWLKLRQRTLGPVLEANGWAVNGRVKVNIPLGAALTELGVLPPGSSRSLEDPFEDKKARRRRRLIWLAAIALLFALAAARWLHIWPLAR